MDETILMPQTPPIELYALSGMVNHAWAQLDALVSAAYIATLDIDPVEAGITLGRLETRAKVEKLKKIFRHRRNEEMVSVLVAISKTLDESKELRNAITHGYYQAFHDGVFMWSILPDFIISGDISATQLFCAMPDDIYKHVHSMMAIISLVRKHFDETALHRLFDLPSHVR